MVPLAIGSQTNGSTIRPAAYCGVVGFKPTHGLISRHRAFALSRTLDHVGLFARSIDDIALLAEQLVGYDENDPDTRPRARIPFIDSCRRRTAAGADVCVHQDARCGNAPMTTPKKGSPRSSSNWASKLKRSNFFRRRCDAWQWHQTIMSAEMAVNLEREWDKKPRSSVGAAATQIERGREVRAVDYQRALGRSRRYTKAFVELFEQRYDAILTPAAPSAAPKGLDATGDPSFCTLWTLLRHALRHLTAA